MASDAVQAYESLDAVRAEIPYDQRTSFVELLSQLIVRPYLVERYLRILTDKHPRHVDVFKSMRNRRGDFPVEAVVESGLAALSDEQLVRFALDDLEITGFCDYLGELVEANQCGSVWFNVILQNVTLPRGSEKTLLEVVGAENCHRDGSLGGNDIAGTEKLLPFPRIAPASPDPDVEGTVPKGRLSFPVRKHGVNDSSFNAATESTQSSSSSPKDPGPETAPIPFSTAAGVRESVPRRKRRWQAGLIAIAAVAAALFLVWSAKPALPPLAPPIGLERAGGQLGSPNDPPAGLTLILPPVPASGSAAILEIVGSTPTLRTRTDESCYPVEAGQAYALRSLKFSSGKDARVLVIWTPAPCGAALAAGIKEGAIRSFAPGSENRLVQEIVAVLKKGDNRILWYRVDALLVPPEGAKE